MPSQPIQNERITRKLRHGILLEVPCMVVPCHGQLLFGCAMVPSFSWPQPASIHRRRQSTPCSNRMYVLQRDFISGIKRAIAPQMFDRRVPERNPCLPKMCLFSGFLRADS